MLCNADADSSAEMNATTAINPPTTVVGTIAESGGRTRSGLPRAVTIIVRPAQAITTVIAATTSDGRCHPPTIVATPVAAVYPAARTATTGRVCRGTTRTSAAATLAATVVWPLGSELSTAPAVWARSGRSSTTYFSICVVTFAPPTRIVTCTASSQRWRMRAMRAAAPSTTTMNGMDTTSRTGSATRHSVVCPISEPRNAVSSMRCPMAVSTKYRHVNQVPTTPAAHMRSPRTALPTRGAELCIIRA